MGSLIHMSFQNFSFVCEDSWLLIRVHAHGWVVDIHASWKFTGFPWVTIVCQNNMVFYLKLSLMVFSLGLKVIPFTGNARKCLTCVLRQIHCFYETQAAIAVWMAPSVEKSCKADTQVLISGNQYENVKDLHVECEFYVCWCLCCTNLLSWLWIHWGTIKVNSSIMHLKTTHSLNLKHA